MLSDTEKCALFVGDMIFSRFLKGFPVVTDRWAIASGKVIANLVRHKLDARMRTQLAHDVDAICHALFRQPLVQRNTQRKCDIGVWHEGAILNARGRQEARRLAPDLATARLGKTVEVPPLQKVGDVSVRLWTNLDIGKARNVLAGIKPGRKKKS